MGQISKDQVIQDTRDAYVEVTGDTVPVTYGGESGLANRIKTLGKLLDNTITFKVDSEDYYISSCKTSATISEPPTPTITSFLYWATTTSSSVSFPYTPTGSTTLVAVYGEGPTPEINVTYTTEDPDVEVTSIVGLFNSFAVPRLGLEAGKSYNISITYDDVSTEDKTIQAQEYSSEPSIVGYFEEGFGELLFILVDGVYYGEYAQQIEDSTKCGICFAKGTEESPISMISITIQGPIESEE